MNERTRLIKEMEDTINLLSPGKNFHYPKEYVEWISEACNLDYGEWEFMLGKRYIEFVMNIFKHNYLIDHLVTFAHTKEETHSCFVLDGLRNEKIHVVNPYSSPEYFFVEEYENFSEWILYHHPEVNICGQCGKYIGKKGEPNTEIGICKTCIEKNIDLFS